MPDLIQGQKVFINVAAGGRLVLKSRTAGDSTVITVLEGCGFDPGTTFSHIGVKEYVFSEAGQVSIESILGSCSYEGFDLLEAQSNGGEQVRVVQDSRGGYALRLTGGKRVELLTEAELSDTSYGLNVLARAQADKISSQAEASRFLQQATLGVTLADINAVTTLGSRRLWLKQQMKLSWAKRIVQRLVDDEGFTASSSVTKVLGQAMMTNMMDDPAKLLSKCVYALSKIFVVSVPGGGFPEGTTRAANPAYWLDLLALHAFGNFRDLLEEITYFHDMGRMLTYYNNEHENADGTSQPDENYAREIMQLFTIGLYELNLDGSLRLDADGQPVPTYTNSDIRQMARVFTGLTRPNGAAGQYTTDSGTNDTTFRTTSFGGTNFATWVINNDNWPPNTLEKKTLRHYVGFYEWGAKKALKGLIDVPAGTQPAANITLAITQLFNHPNVGPFLAKRLISSLVTSNPSPAYVARVASAFNNNGFGVRGDMKAVWTAILCDPEATLEGRKEGHFGRVKDGFDLCMQLYISLRGFNNAAKRVMDDNNHDSSMNALYGNWPAYSPSIFHFYDPLYSPQSLLTQGLSAPETQMWEPNLTAKAFNRLVNRIQTRGPDQTSTATSNYLNYADLTLNGTTAQLVDSADLLLCGGQLSSAARTAILAAIASMPTSTALEQQRRANTVLMLIMATPEFLVQL